MPGIDSPQNREADREGMSLPKLGIDLDGFSYDQIARGSTKDADSRLHWVELQNLDEIERTRLGTDRTDTRSSRWLRRWWSGPQRETVQPYGVLAELYRRDGNRADARKAAVEQYRQAGRTGNPLQRMWSWILWWTVGYGYRPGRILRPALAAYVILLVLVAFADRANQMVPTTDADYVTKGAVGGGRSVSPPLYPWAYAAEAFLPVVRLGQTTTWKPVADTVLGSFVNITQIIVSILGWLLTGIFVAAITGIIKRD